MTAAARRASAASACRSSRFRRRRSWGIGEFADLPAFGSWCAAAGQRYVQLLPLNEISPGETSPYSSMTAMALDPDLHPSAGGARLRGARRRSGPARRRARRAGDRVRASRRTSRYAEVRALKIAGAAARLPALRRRGDRSRHGPRARPSRAYAARESWWLDDYTTFRALHAAHEERAWWDWPPALALRRSGGASGRAAPRWQTSVAIAPGCSGLPRRSGRRPRQAAGVRVLGDLPFMMSGDSPDVWARHERVHARCHGGRAAGCLQRDRAGLGPAAVAAGT